MIARQTATRPLPWLAAAPEALARLAATRGPAIEEVAQWCVDGPISVARPEPPVGPGSTARAVAIVHSLEVRIAELPVERRAMPPAITRASVLGPERSQRLFDEAYREHARHLARAIIQTRGGA